MKKILTVVGARPQFTKAAVLSRLIASSSGVKEVMIHTGQHFDANMSDVFFNALNIPSPAYFLGVNSMSHGAMTGKMMADIEPIVTEERPDIVLVYGDTNSTLAGALIASKCHIPVVHVEAGLRSFNKKMPEEVNRILTDHVSDMLFSPTIQGVKNLKAEGITQGVHHTGDVMYDATLFAKKHIYLDLLLSLGLTPGGFALFTLHRQESTDHPEVREKIMTYVKEYAKSRNLKIVWPVHPRMRKHAEMENDPIFHKVDPLSYAHMHTLLHSSHSILTDSGGLQKEAYFHQKPCVTLRSETEWVETINAGWNRLWTVDAYSSPKKIIEEYGDGHAGEAMLKLIENM